MSDQERIERIVGLRQHGFTWGQIEAELFPQSRYILTGQGNRDSWNLACKHKEGAAAGAFSKKVIGCFSPTQIVVKNPGFVKKVNGEACVKKAEVAQVVEMFI